MGFGLATIIETTFTHGGVMDHYVALGVFAMYAMSVTLFRLLFYIELPRVRTLKRVWGRTRGVAIYFVTDVLLPLALGIMFLARGLSMTVA